MKHVLNYSLVITLLLLSFSISAQEDEDVLKKVDYKEAERKLLAGNYDEALDDFLALLATDHSNAKYNYDVAVCYLNSHGNKEKALPYIERVVHKDKHDPNADFLLARAYMFSKKFDEAIAAFNRFKLNGKGNAANMKEVDQEIQYCINAKELMKFPVNVKFENLGNHVNSEYNEHYAFIPSNESFMLFNTDRPEKGGIKMENGEYPNSIYYSEVRDGVFQKASCIGLPICKGNTGEEIIGLSSTGDIILLYIKTGSTGNIYISEKDKDGSFKKPVMLDKHINSPHEEIAASISSDGNIIYFASNRPGGLGGTDIYLSRKGAGGKWSLPINLGPAVNTPLNEDFPNISPDGATLYFSSNGHTSMGGYDVFKVTLDEGGINWQNAKNLGYPVNTIDDDLNFRISASNRYGYISEIREGGSGDFDIYRVVFNDVEPELSVIHGEINAEDGSKINYPDVLITVSNEVTGDVVGNYLPNPNTGKYVIILPPGKYSVIVELFGFELLKKKLEVLDKVSYQSEITFDIKLATQK